MPVWLRSSVGLFSEEGTRTTVRQNLPSLAVLTGVLVEGCIAMQRCCFMFLNQLAVAAATAVARDCPMPCDGKLQYECAEKTFALSKYRV